MTAFFSLRTLSPGRADATRKTCPVEARDFSGMMQPAQFTKGPTNLDVERSVLTKAAAIFARIKADLARREAVRVARKALADDVAIRKMLVGVPFAKRRAAAMPSARAASLRPQPATRSSRSGITIASGRS